MKLVKKQNLARARKGLLPWLFLAPTLSIIVVMTLYPLVYSVLVSFSSYDLSLTAIKDWVGLRNYVEAFRDWRLLNSVKVTVLFILVVVPMEFLFGLGIALLVDVENKFMNFLRTYILIPMMLPPVGIGILWRLMFQPQLGILNYFLRLFGQTPVYWLATRRNAFFSVCLVDIWQWTPFLFLVLFAGLRSIPPTIIDAAKVDGCTSWQKLRHIILPILKPTILIVVTLRLLDAIRIYDIVYVLTMGGPAGATDVYSLLLWRKGLKFFNIESAAALSIILLIGVAVMAYLLLFKVVKLKI